MSNLGERLYEYASLALPVAAVGGLALAFANGYSTHHRLGSDATRNLTPPQAVDYYFGGGSPHGGTNALPANTYGNQACLANGPYDPTPLDGDPADVSQEGDIITDKPSGRPVLTLRRDPVSGELTATEESRDLLRHLGCFDGRQ